MPSIGEDVECLEHSCTVGWKTGTCVHLVVQQLHFQVRAQQKYMHMIDY